MKDKLSEEEECIIFIKHWLKDDEGVFRITKKEVQHLLNAYERQKKIIDKK